MGPSTLVSSSLSSLSSLSFLRFSSSFRTNADVDTEIDSENEGSSEYKTGCDASNSYTFQWSTLTPWILLIPYAIGTFHVTMKFRQLWQLSPRLDITKYFVLSVLLSCLGRAVCFLLMGMLTSEQVNITGQSQDDDGNNPTAVQLFSSKFVPLLLDIPDFLIIAAYVLLVLVWCEAFSNSRRHLFIGNRNSFRHTWTRFYMIFFVILILIQVCLYIILFAPASKWPHAQTVAISMIFIIVCGFNGALLPLMFITLYFYLQCRYSGFPPGGERSKNNLKRINHVLRWWTFGRITWGVFTLVVLKKDWLCSSTNITANTLATICLFTVTELFPFSVSLDPDLLAMIANDQQVRDVLNSSSSSGNLLAEDYNNNNHHHNRGSDTSISSNTKGGDPGVDMDNEEVEVDEENSLFQHSTTAISHSHNSHNNNTSSSYHQQRSRNGNYPNYSSSSTSSIYPSYSQSQQTPSSFSTLPSGSFQSAISSGSRVTNIINGIDGRGKRYTDRNSSGRGVSTEGIEAVDKSVVTPNNERHFKTPINSQSSFFSDSASASVSASSSSSSSGSVSDSGSLGYDDDYSVTSE